jgi:zinc protease
MDYIDVHSHLLEQHMPQLSRFLVASLAFVCLIISVCLGEPLPTDPALITGQLDNGLRYVVRQHSVPPGRAAIWIHFHTGSLNETDRQRGLAHYLEHLAFNGSENFKPGTLVPFFQSMGMTFGRDQNAFTSYDETTYQLSLPNVQPETIGKGMMYFRDVVGGLLLLPSEIDAERQIILEERRRGLSARQRTSEYIMPRLFPGSIFGCRSPIGTEETIKSATQDDFKDYYGKWYSASNATLIVIADTDPQIVVKVIQEQFGNSPARQRPTRQELSVKPYEKSFAIVATDPELRSASVRIEQNGPARPPTTTVEQYRDDLVLGLGVGALNHRLREKAQSNTQPYNTATAGSADLARAVRSVEITARSEPSKWKESLEAIALELHRARQFGFSDRELERERKDLLTAAERSVETEPTSPAAFLIRRINNAVGSEEPIMSAPQRLDLLKRILPSITRDEVAKRFAAEFDPKAVAFVAELPSSVSPIPSESELLSIGLAALNVAPTPPDADKAATDRLVQNLPTPGTVVEGTEHAPTQVWSGWLSNNTRVHYRFMDQRKDEVSVNIQLIGGQLHENAGNRGVTRAAELAWSRPATKHLPSADIREFMTGRKISVRGGGGGGGGRGGGGRGRGGGGIASSDAISLTVSGAPAELETGMQLAYLLLTEPLVEQAGFDQYKDRTRESLQEEVTNPMQLGARLVTQALYPDNEIRLTPLMVEQVDRLSLSAAQECLDTLIKNSPIEVVIVGDLPKDKAIELVARYVGSLPSRPRVGTQTWAELRKIKRPDGPRVLEKDVSTPTNQAYVYSGFYGADETNRHDVRALNMSSRILSTRMVKQVREEAQLVYSIGATNRAGSTFPGFGAFSASAPTDPDKAAALVSKLSSMYQAFAKDGPTSEELDVAKKQYATTYAEQLKEPSFWSGRLQQLTFRGITLDELAEEPQAYQDLTAEHVKSVFARYYSKESSMTVVVRPQAPDPQPARARE